MDLMDFTLVESGRPVADIYAGDPSDRGQQEAINILKQAVKDKAGTSLEVTRHPRDSSQTLHVVVGTGEDPLVAELLSRDNVMLTVETWQSNPGKYQLFQDLGDQGFIIWVVSENGHKYLVLGANTNQGLFYGAHTLAARAESVHNRLGWSNIGGNQLPIMNVPAFKYRSIATNIGGPDWLGFGQWAKEWKREEGYDYKGFIDWLASYKINHISLWTFNLAFGIAYDSDRFPEMVNPYHPNVQQEFIADLIDYAHRRYIEVDFFFDFPDNWTAVLRSRPELAGQNIDMSGFPGGEKWETYQKLGSVGGQFYRSNFSWVCASKPGVMEFWLAYLDELLERYPTVDGVGGQWCEHRNTRCNCSNCRELFFELQYRYFRSMVEATRRRKPSLRAWFYDSYGARDIVLHQDEIPNLTRVDWGSDATPYYLQRAIPKGQWYLYHRSGDRWPESGTKYMAEALSSHNLDGIQMRAVYYREHAHTYSAFGELSWNPGLRLADLARLYYLRAQGTAEGVMTSAYTDWMQMTGLWELCKGQWNSPRQGQMAAARQQIRRQGIPEQLAAIRERVAETLPSLPPSRLTQWMNEDFHKFVCEEEG